MREAWLVWRKRRALLLVLGKISAVFFFCAALAVLDGVQDLLRTPQDELVLLAGEETGISGPCPFQNPVASDLLVRISDAANVTFRQEGFFAGYLLGNGMWRGTLWAKPTAPTERVSVHVSFRGMAQGQRFVLRVYASKEELREDAPSLLFRFVGISPFWLAFGTFFGGLIFAILTLWLGKKNSALLVDLGCAEIFRAKRAEDGVSLWCSAHGASLRRGDSCVVLSSEGDVCAHARLISQQKNVLCLQTDEHSITDGYLVCVCPEKGGVDAGI